MESNLPNILKGSKKDVKPPSCIIDLVYLRRLYSSLKELNNDAIRLQNENMIKRPDQSENEFQEIKKEMEHSIKLSLGIYDFKGESIISQDDSILNDTAIPDSIEKVIIDNFSVYQVKYNEYPQNTFRIEFDFSKPDIFNFNIIPSWETMNTSRIIVNGLNQGWVDATFERVNNSLQERKMRRSWLHGKNSYNLLLWGCVIPLVFFNIYKLDIWAKPLFLNVSNVLQIALFSYAFILQLLIFLLIFKYIRWLFPYMEYKSSLKNKHIRHRIIIFTITTLFLSPLIADIYNIVKSWLT